jgi:hypothetical protein
VLIALKGRNALILSRHLTAQCVGRQSSDLIVEVLRGHSALVESVQWVRRDPEDPRLAVRQLDEPS